MPRKIISGLLLSLAILVVAIMQSSCFGSSISSTRSKSTYLQKNIYLNISLTIPKYNAGVVFTNYPLYRSSRLFRTNSNNNMEPILLSSKCSMEILHRQTAILKENTYKMILVNDLPHNRRNLRKTSPATSKGKIRSKKFHFMCPLKIHFPNHKSLKCRVSSVVELTPTAQNHNSAFLVSGAKLSSLNNMSTVFYPKPHPWRAIYFPSPAEYTVMQIKMPNETAETSDVEIISFPHNDSMEVLTIFENNSDIYNNGEDMVFVLFRYCNKLYNYLSDLTAGIKRMLRSGKNNRVWSTKVLIQSTRGFEKRTIGDVHRYRGLHLNSRGEKCCYLRDISKKLRNYRLLILHLLPLILVVAYYEIFKLILKKFVAKIATIKKLLFGKEYSSDNAGDGPSNESSNTPSTNMSQLLRIAAWNCNGHIAVRGGKTIAETIQKNDIDIMLLSDTRLDDRNSKAKVKQMRRLLPGYSIISFTTSRSSFTNRGGMRMNTMGGTMIVIAPWCAVKIKDTFQDSSGLGIAGGVSLILNKSTYDIISMYQPIGSDQSGESTIISRLQKILHKKNISDSPKLFIGNTISLWIQRAYSKGHIPIVAGDFNADPSLSSGSYLRRWALDCGIISALHNLWKRRYFTHMAKGKPISSIDHIYVASSIESEISDGKIINSPMIQAESDHSVIAIAIRCQIRYITQDTAQKEQRPSKRIELSHNNAAERNEFANLMDTWIQNNNDFQELTPSQKLHDIMVQSVQTTHHIKGKKHRLSQRVGPRSSFKDGYSPCYMALLAAYDLVLTYHNKALKAFYDNRLQIAREHMHSKFIALSHEWEKQYTPDMFRADEKNSASYHAARQVLFNIRLLQNISIDDLFTRATSLKNLMHGRLRSEMRQRTNSYLQKMEQLRQENKIGQLFSMVNLNDKQSLDLSTLNISGNVIKNPQDIHQKLSEHFTDWYATPDNLHAIAQKFLSGNFWYEIAEGKTSITSDRHPKNLRAKLFENACKIKASPEQQQDILTLVSAPLSYDEYTKEIKKMKSGKAPGPSGATANMIKAWSSEIHEEVFQNLNEIWLSNTIPDWWLKGHLRPIPKPGAPSLENLRPLGLYEISRKILTAIIIKRIYMAWEKYSLLNNNQYAFRRGRGTSHAILRLINASEDACERDIPLWQIMWDFRRAFDSIPFNFTRLALYRLGVPRSTIEFLVTMMENNNMTVASPFHMANHYEDIKAPCEDLSFHQERGTGQGDPPSPIIWIAIFDILLSMLEAAPDLGSFYAQASVSSLYKVQDTAYADDLATISSSFHLQQEKADIVSTFCACSGLQIADAKVRVYAINANMYPPNIILHNSNWQATAIHPNTDSLALKYLGFYSDHLRGDASAFEITESYLRKVSGLLIYSRASRETKLLVYTKQIVPKVLYMATKACWSLEEYRQLDKYAAKILKNIGGHMFSSPDTMMFFPTDQCGSGLHAISDLSQTQKWGDLVRALDSKCDAKHAAEGLLERALRQTVQQAMSSQHRSILPINTKFLKCFVGSLVEWGNITSTCLTQAPLFEHYPSNSAILLYVDGRKESDKLIRQLQKRDITVQGELTRRSHNGQIKWETDSMAQLFLKTLPQDNIIDPDDENLILNNGQMYQIGEKVIEIIGKVQNHQQEYIKCYEWFHTSSPKNCIIRSVHHNLAEIQIDYQQIKSHSLIRLGTVPTQSSKIPDRFTVRRIVTSSPCAVPTRGTLRQQILPEKLQLLIESLQNITHQQGCSYSIFTDGSYQLCPVGSSAILMTQAQIREIGHASAALVALANDCNWREKPILLLQLDSSYGFDAYAAELIALTAAAHAQNTVPGTEIYSDCQAACATISRATNLEEKKTKLCSVRAVTNSLQNLHMKPRIQWTRSHPERLRDKENWSFQDGVYI